jgi:hypothetical protein
MIQTETLASGLIRTYSDRNLMIEQETGALYEEAVDIPNSGHTYTETDIPIESDITDSQALDILLGRGMPDEIISNNEAQESD